MFTNNRIECSRWAGICSRAVLAILVALVVPQLSIADEEIEAHSAQWNTGMPELFNNSLACADAAARQFILTFSPITEANGETINFIFANDYSRRYVIVNAPSTSACLQAIGPVVPPGGGGGSGGGGCGSCSGESNTPIILDLAGDGLELGPPGSTVFFDMEPGGDIEELQWVAIGGDEAFLVIDRNENGFIDSGAELFGNYTPLANGETARHGFSALAQFDHPRLGGNDDGRISRHDVVWSVLALWNDLDANGVSSANELTPIAESSVRSIRTGFRRRDIVDEAGNHLKLWSRARTTSGLIDVVDVFFAAP